MKQAATLDARVIADCRRRAPRVFSRPGSERALRVAIGAAFALAVILSLWRVDADPARLWAGLSKLGFLVNLMMPPTTGGQLWTWLHALGETLAMALLGTALAVLAALPIGFLGAKNVISRTLFRFSLRRFLDGSRGIDTLIWALIFVAAVGLGPFAGILAIAASDVGTLSKLLAEAIENVDRRPIEGVRASGGGWLSVQRFAVLPQVFPVLISNALYFLESNTRSASILGIVGAGGIGLHLSDRIGSNDWDAVAGIVILVLITVAVIDGASRLLRRRLIDASPNREGMRTWIQA
jgi:phosphonate transport system permease protein